MKRQSVLQLLLLVLLLALGSGPALAHGEGEEADAAALAEQAIGFLQVDPPDVMSARERLEDALKAEDPAAVTDVNLKLVEAALTTLDEGAVSESIQLLELALGREPEVLGPVVSVQLGAGISIAFAIGLLLVGLGAFGLGRRAGRKVSGRHSALGGTA